MAWPSELRTPAAAIAAAVSACLAATEKGHAPPPPWGAICCLRKHRLRSVSLPGPAAVCVLEGRKTLFRGDESLTVPAGGLFVLPGQMEVGIENAPDAASGRYLALCLDLPPGMLARAVAAMDAPTLGPAVSLRDFLVRVDDPLAQSLHHLVTMTASCPDNRRLLDLCLEAALVLVAERTGVIPLLQSAAATWRARVACLIGQDPGRAWTTADVAGRLGASERNLRRNLKAEGTGLRHILQDARLTAALTLLQSGRATVGEAACLCGYQSASRFAVRFRERYGVSPSDILRFRAVSGEGLAETERTEGNP